MTPEKLIREFATTVINDKITISKFRIKNNWLMSLGHTHPYMVLPTNIFYEPEEMDKIFREDMIKRYYKVRGFSNITISILHELGHWATRNQFDAEEEAKQVAKVKNMYDHINVISERLATDWAIQWLYDAEHRAMAKAFEKELFKLKRA